MEVSHMNLGEYLAGFYQETTRDQVLEEIVKDNLLKRAFEMPEGRMLLDAAVTQLQQGIIGAMNAILKGDEPAVQRHSYRIHVIKEIMSEWASILAQGKTHEDIMKKKLKKEQ